MKDLFVAPGECPKSEREDKKHTWMFDGDDPYVTCHYCGEVRDALTSKPIKQATSDGEIGSRANDVPAKASPLDFHKQVEAILDAHAGYYIKETVKFFSENGESPALGRNNTGDLKALAAITALIQTLVPEESVLDSPLQQSWKLGGTDQVSFRHGFRACRDIILSTIKGKE